MKKILIMLFFAIIISGAKLSTTNQFLGIDFKSSFNDVVSSRTDCISDGRAEWVRNCKEELIGIPFIFSITRIKKDSQFIHQLTFDAYVDIINTNSNAVEYKQIRRDSFSSLVSLFKKTYGEPVSLEEWCAYHERIRGPLAVKNEWTLSRCRTKENRSYYLDIYSYWIDDPYTIELHYVEYELYTGNMVNHLRFYVTNARLYSDHVETISSENSFGP